MRTHRVALKRVEATVREDRSMMIVSLGLQESKCMYEGEYVNDSVPPQRLDTLELPPIGGSNTVFF